MGKTITKPTTSSTTSSTLDIAKLNLIATKIIDSKHWYGDDNDIETYIQQIPDVKSYMYVSSIIKKKQQVASLADYLSTFMDDSDRTDISTIVDHIKKITQDTISTIPQTNKAWAEKWMNTQAMSLQTAAGQKDDDAVIEDALHKEKETPEESNMGTLWQVTGSVITSTLFLEFIAGIALLLIGRGVLKRLFKNRFPALSSVVQRGIGVSGRFTDETADEVLNDPKVVDYLNSNVSWNQFKKSSIQKTLRKLSNASGTGGILQGQGISKQEANRIMTKLMQDPSFERELRRNINTLVKLGMRRGIIGKQKALSWVVDPNWTPERKQLWYNTINSWDKEFNFRNIATGAQTQAVDIAKLYPNVGAELFQKLSRRQREWLRNTPNATYDDIPKRWQRTKLASSIPKNWPFDYFSPKAFNKLSKKQKAWVRLHPDVYPMESNGFPFKKGLLGTHDRLPDTDRF